MKHNLAIFCGSIALLAVCLSAHAHDGHGHSAADGHSPLHYLSEPIHLIPLAMVAVIAFAAIYGFVRLRRGKSNRTTAVSETR